MERRRAESEPEKKAQNVLGQWADYLARCKTLGRDRDDPMIYRPRELKRRHDETVEEVRCRQMLKEAERMQQRFPGAEEVLAEIREKYEYAGKDYRIRVPAFLAEIVAEGRALLLAQGGAARDAYYTIEVEPGGSKRSTGRKKVFCAVRSASWGRMTRSCTADCKRPQPAGRRRRYRTQGCRLERVPTASGSPGVAVYSCP